MMNYLKIIARLSLWCFILWICTGCPYESPIPISQATIPIDKKLLGKWTDSPESNDFFEVKAKSDYVYLIEENIFSKVRKVHEVKKYYAHFSKIDEAMFLNISPRDSLEKPIRDDFLLYKVKASDSLAFTLMPISEHIDEKFMRSEDLERFIRQHKHLSFFYGDESAFQRFDFRRVKWK